MTNQSAALQLADDLDRMYDNLDPYNGWRQVVDYVGEELRKQHAKIVQLESEVDRLKSKMKPLSAAVIEELQDDYVFFGSATEIVRAIEAELGIGGNNE